MINIIHGILLIERSLANIQQMAWTFMQQTNKKNNIQT